MMKPNACRTDKSAAGKCDDNSCFSITWRDWLCTCYEVERGPVKPREGERNPFLGLESFSPQKNADLKESRFLQVSILFSNFRLGVTTVLDGGCNFKS